MYICIHFVVGFHKTGRVLNTSHNSTFADIPNLPAFIRYNNYVFLTDRVVNILCRGVKALHNKDMLSEGLPP